VLRWLGDLRQRRYDLVVDLQGLFRSGFFTWMTRAPRRIGFGNAAELGWLGYNRRHVIDRRWHAVDRMAGLLEAQGYTPSRDLTLYCGESDLRWRHELLGDDGEPYALVAPVARWRSKTWPADRFADLIDRLLQSQLAGPRVVVLASPTEQAAIAPIVQRCAGDARVLLPRTTVGQMMALIAGARLVVCNDSGPLHVAVGFKRAITAIFGPTDPSLVGPYRRDECVVQPPGIGAMGGRAYRRNPDDQSLISQVTLDRVWEHMQQQVKAPAPSH
jgi:ADP-heptose:LPS heptosyltransferase